MNYCIKCENPVSPDEEGLTKKLVNRGTDRFMCISCLAKHFEVKEESLVKQIKYFKEMGCSLFSNGNL